MSTTNILDLNNRIDELEKNGGGGGSADSAKRSDIAAEFSTETSYTAGNFVYYEGKLYQFNTDHAAGAWDSTDVVEANVTDQIVSNASAIAGLTASDVAYDNTDSGLTATDVKGAIDEVENSLDGLTADTGWVAIDNSYLWYRKIGSIVNVIAKTPTTAVSSWTLLGTLPEGARPYKPIYQSPYVESGYYNLLINTDGEVYYFQTSNGSTTGNFTYIA